MAKSHIEYLTIDELQIPVKVIREWRHSVRISIAKDRVNLRLPIYLSSSKHRKQNLQWAQKWLVKTFHTKPELRVRFKPRNYHNGQVFEINSHQFKLYIRTEARKTSKFLIDSKNIQLVLADKLDQIEQQRLFPKLLSRAAGKFFLLEISHRVHQLNDEYFQQDLGQIRLKHNKTNWGSCSAKRNINLSTRLLFAPKEVQDYVIIHELAHLIELNHSEAFWKILSGIDPHYKDKEQWLKTNAHLCRF